MLASWRHLVLFLFLLSVIFTGLVGTSASMTFVWPAYGLLGVAAVLSIGLLFDRLSFSLPRWTFGLILLLVVYGLARASEAPVAYFAREDAALIVVAFLAYGLSYVLLTSTETRKRFVDALAVIVVVNLLFALAQTVVSPTLWIFPGYERTFVDRAGGLFNHPDHFTGFLAMLVPLWLATAIFGRRTRPTRLMAGALALVSTTVVLVTGGAAAILALIAGLSVFAVLVGRILRPRLQPEAKRSVQRYLAISAVVALFILIAASGPLTRAFDRSLLHKGGELSLVEVWRAGWEQAEMEPLLGTGSRTSYLFGRLFRSESLNSAAVEPEFVHNEYLQALADYGVVGLLLVLVVLVMHAVSGFRFVCAYAGFSVAPGRLLPRSDHLALTLGSMAALGVLAVLACFDFVLHLPVFVVISAILLALVAAPDPMATALKSPVKFRFLPGGGFLFSNRAVVFACGLAVVLLSVRFSRSEYHYEKARLAFETDREGFQHLRHLKSARALDPKNPYILTLSAHAQVAGITPDMPAPARRQALEQADVYFGRARDLYPQDIFAAVGHAAVLEELDRSGEALERLRAARKLAPHYGNLMLAEAELHLRNGRISEAERTFGEAMNAFAYRDTAAAQRGLLTVTEWKLIAEQNGVDWRVTPDAVESEPLLAGPGGYRSLPEAKVAERDLAGQSPPNRETQEVTVEAAEVPSDVP